MIFIYKKICSANLTGDRTHREGRGRDMIDFEAARQCHINVKLMVYEFKGLVN